MVDEFVPFTAKVMILGRFLLDYLLVLFKIGHTIPIGGYPITLGTPL
jgi:hypothetical protein